VESNGVGHPTKLFAASLLLKCLDLGLTQDSALRTQHSALSTQHFIATRLFSLKGSNAARVRV